MPNTLLFSRTFQHEISGLQHCISFSVHYHIINRQDQNSTSQPKNHYFPSARVGTVHDVIVHNKSMYKTEYVEGIQEVKSGKGMKIIGGEAGLYMLFSGSG